MVSKLSRLLAKGKEYEAGEDEQGAPIKFVIKPMKNKDFLQLMEFSEVAQKDKSKTEDMIVFFVKKSIERDDPEVTDSDVREMPTNHLIAMLKLASEVNGLGDMFDFQASGQSSNLTSAVSQPASAAEQLAKLKASAQQTPS